MFSKCLEYREYIFPSQERTAAEGRSWGGSMKSSRTTNIGKSSLLEQQHSIFKHMRIKVDMANDFTSRNDTNTTGREGIQNLTAQGTVEHHHITPRWPCCQQLHCWRLLYASSKMVYTVCSQITRYSQGKGISREDSRWTLQTHKARHFCGHKFHITSHGDILQLNSWRLS